MKKNEIRCFFLRTTRHQRKQFEVEIQVTSLVLRFVQRLLAEVQRRKFNDKQKRKTNERTILLFSEVPFTVFQPSETGSCSTVGHKLVRFGQNSQSFCRLR